MPDSLSGWLRSLAAEATRVPDPHKDSEEQWIARGRAINQARKLAPDLAVLLADAIDALAIISSEDEGVAYELPEWALVTDPYFKGSFRPAAVARVALARFAALQPGNTKEGT